MAEFVNMDYAEIEALWQEQRPTRSRLAGQLRGMERGVPVRVVTRSDLSKATSRSSLVTNVRKAMKTLGYEDWAEVMVIVHEGRVIVCRPFGEMPKPTLRTLDASEQRFA